MSSLLRNVTVIVLLDLLKGGSEETLLDLVSSWAKISLKTRTESEVELDF